MKKILIIDICLIFVFFSLILVFVYNALLLSNHFESIKSLENQGWSTEIIELNKDQILKTYLPMMLFSSLAAICTAFAIVWLSISNTTCFKPLLDKLQARKQARQAALADKAEADKQARIAKLESELEELKKN